MYCDYFGFTEKPFNVTPNPRFIFLSKNHREAFAHLLYGIDNHAGFVELTGEVGTGKTTVLRTLLTQLDDDNHRTALILNPSLSPVELLRSINREYNIPWEGMNRAELLDALNRFLLAENREGRTITLVVDEAQNLEPAALEQIRLISNLETETDKLIQIVLVGQPELGTLLGRPELRQLAQRITVRYSLSPMDFEDTATYIDHRVKVAGGWGTISFKPAALKRIYRFSGGIPRLINIACDRSILIAYTDERREVSARMVGRAIAELKGKEKKGSPASRIAAAVFCALAVAIVSGMLFVSRPPLRSPLPVEATAQPASRQPQPQKAAIPPDLFDALRKEQVGRSELESAALAFNAVAPLWKVQPFTDEAGPERFASLKVATGKRGLQLAKFSASLDVPLRSNTPAILEYTLPGVTGKRYVAVTASSASGQLTVAPPLLGRTSFTRSEIEAFWSGRGYVPWKNYRQIPRLVAVGARGTGVTRLQELLRTVGVYNGPQNGVFDAATIAAVRKFQAGRGIGPTGTVDSLTLMLLYQSAGRFSPPRLVASRETTP